MVRLSSRLARRLVLTLSALVGVTHDAAQLRQEHDVVVMATGATWPRDLSLPNRTLDGIHYAMEFLQVSIDSSLVSSVSLTFDFAQLNTASLLNSNLEDGKYVPSRNSLVLRLVR